MAADPTLPHAELVGSALAETGRCEEAALFVREVMAQAEAAVGETTLARLARVQQTYESGTPCRPPVGSEP